MAFESAPYFDWYLQTTLPLPSTISISTEFSSCEPTTRARYGLPLVVASILNVSTWCCSATRPSRLGLWLIFPASVVIVLRAFSLASTKALSIRLAYWPTCTEPETAAFFSISPANQEARLRPLSICCCNESRDWLKASADRIICRRVFSNSSSFFQICGYLRNSSSNHCPNGWSPRAWQEVTKELIMDAVCSGALISSTTCNSTCVMEENSSSLIFWARLLFCCVIIFTVKSAVWYIIKWLW